MTGTTTHNSKLIRDMADVLAEAVVALQYQQQPEIWQPYGDPGRLKSVRDARYHFNYLAEALDAADPTLFVDYVSWVRTLFDNLGFPATVLPATLDCIRQVLPYYLPPEASASAEVVIAEAFYSLTDKLLPQPGFLIGQEPIDHLARTYLAALLAGRRDQASQLILRAVEDGIPVKDIYLRVFQPSQHELGRLWQINQISVAQEHYCTAATQLIMSQLYPFIFNDVRKGPRMVVSCVGGELHEIGARMVADFLEMDGWSTYFLGANTPDAAIVSALTERRADILAISVTMTFHVEQVRELIRQVRQGQLPVKIMVGGYPFNLSPELWRSVGADGFAPDAQTAIRLAERLIG